MQGFPPGDQILSLARLAEARVTTGLFAPRDVEVLFDDIGLPRPVKMSNAFGRLENAKLLTRVRGARGAAWKLTPLGRERSTGLATDMDLAAVTAGQGRGVAYLGATAHPVVPPSLAPPELVEPLHAFLDEHPFDQNVFGMTRFPNDDEDEGADPVATAIEAARTICAEEGLEFHLASDRQIVDDLWPNVAAHLWGSKYGIAFFEDRVGNGVNYNLTIEVGSMIALGRRVAILKDKSIDKLPTNLVGRIYKSVDLDKPAKVKATIRTWITDDLRERT